MTDRSAEWAARRRAWEAERLAPALERAPERRERFSTIGDTTVERLYGPWSSPDADPLRDIGLPGRAAVHPRHPPDRLPQPALDDADVRRVRCRRGHERALPPAPRGRPDRASRSPTTCRRCTATTPTTRRPRASSGRAASASRAWPTWRSCSTGCRSTRVSTSMTINSPGRADLGDVHRRRREGRRPARPARGHDPERHPQGVRRPEGVPVPADAVDAPGDRHDRVRDARDAALEHGLDQRLPHPRGRLDRDPGAGLHDRRRDGLRRGGARARAAGRRLRAAAQLLLQQPQRLLRGDRQVPGVAPDLAQADDRALRRRERALGVDALPHPDRGRVADPAAAAQQPDAGGPPGAGRGPGRHAVAPHRCLRRGAGRPDRRGRPAGPPPAADHRRGERGGRHGRPARRVVVRRGADRRDRGGRLALPRRDRPARRDGRRDHRGLPAARDRRRRLPLPARVRCRRAAGRRDQRLRRRGRADDDPGPGRAARFGGAPPGPAGGGPVASGMPARWRPRCAACARPPPGPNRARRT